MTNIRLLKKSDNRANFSCGEIELDYYFQKFVGQNQFKHFIGATYVATDDKTIFGFVTVSSGSLIRDDLPQNIQKKFPNYPLPILHISRLGVDVKYQNKGLGKALMVASFKLALEQKEKFGCIGVLVDAKVDAVAFYENLGFVQLEVTRGLSRTHPLPVPMFMVMQTIEKAQ